MEKEKLKVVLEHKQDVSEMEKLGFRNVMGYRYGVGDFRLQFVQDVKKGNIYSGVQLYERENVVGGLGDKFEFSIRYGAEYYPTEFQVRTKSVRMDIGEAREFARDLERACDVMQAVRDFFENSWHRELYCKGHGIAFQKGQELAGADGDFPTLEEVRRDYRGLMGIIGDVKTVAQARDVAEQYGIPDYVEGAGADVVSLRVGAFGCLRNVYYPLDGGAPEFDVWSNAWGANFLTEITVDVLTEENYREWVEDARTQVEPAVETKSSGVRKEDELISRKFLLGEIQAYFERKGPEWTGVLDEDCERAWVTIENFHREDGDLVSREGLMDALLGEFGCDLAYYGGDLRIFQDAIVGIAAASKGEVDELIAGATQRGCTSKGLGKGKEELGKE